MKEFFKKHKRLTKVLIMILVLCLISYLSLLIMYLFGIIYFDDGIQISLSLFEKFSKTWHGCLIIILAQVIITSLLSFIPGTSMAFIVLLQGLYKNPVVAFIVAFAGVMASSLMMYIIGRFGGYSVSKKILGEEDCKKASELLNNKGNIFFPMMMMFPIFPDDALIMIAGTLKMSLKWFIPSVIIGRGIGVATIVFGITLVPFDKFTSIWHWILFVIVCLIFMAFVFYMANKFNKYMEKKRNANKEINNSNIEKM